MDPVLGAPNDDCAVESAGTAVSDSPSELYAMLCAVTKEEQEVRDAITHWQSACEKLRTQIVEEKAKTAVKRDRLPDLCAAIEVEQANKQFLEAHMRGIDAVLEEAKLSMDKAEDDLEAACASDGLGLSEWALIQDSGRIDDAEALFASPSEIPCLLSSLRKKISNVRAMVKLQQGNAEEHSDSKKHGAVEHLTARAGVLSRSPETGAAGSFMDDSDAATAVVVDEARSSRRRRLHFDEDCLENVTWVRKEPACRVQGQVQETHMSVGSVTLNNVDEAATPHGLLVSTTRILWSSAKRHDKPNVTKWVYFNPKHSS